MAAVWGRPGNSPCQLHRWICARRLEQGRRPAVGAVANPRTQRGLWRWCRLLL